MGCAPPSTGAIDAYRNGASDAARRFRDWERRAADIVLGIDVTLVGRFAVPNYRLGVVLGHAEPQLVHLAKLGLRFGDALLGEWPPFAQRHAVVATLERLITGCGSGVGDHQKARIFAHFRLGACHYM